MSLTEQEIEKLKNTTVVQLAMQLEEGLLHMKSIDEEMSVLEFISNYLHEF